MLSALVGRDSCQRISADSSNANSANFGNYRGVRRIEYDEIAAKRRMMPSAARRNQRQRTTDFSRVGGVRIAAPPLVEPDVRLFRIRLSCSLSPLAFTG